MANQQQERRRREGYTSARSQAVAHESGVSTSTLKIPEGITFFQPKKGVYKIDILPYKVGKGNPWADPGMMHYERTFFVYRNIGPDKKQVVCPSKTFNKPDFIAEFRQKESRKETADAEYLKTLAPKERQLFVIHDHGCERGKEVQLWEFSYHCFGKLLNTRIKNSDERKGWDLFFLPDEDGFTLEITFDEESGGAYSFIEAKAIDFDARDKALPDSFVNHGICLDDLLVEIPYEKLKAMFLGEDVEGEGAEDTGGEEQREEKPKKERREERQEEPPPRKEKEKPRPRTAKEAGLAKGDTVEYDKREWEIMRISGDGTSLTLIREVDGDDEIEKAIGVEEVRKLEGSAGDEEAPFEAPAKGNGKAKGKEPEPAGAAREKDFDEDWD